MTYCPVKDSFSFLGGMNPDTSFSCYLISVLSFNIFVLSKYWLIFAISHCFILFLSTSGAVSSVKTGKNRYLVGYKLLSVAVICSIYFMLNGVMFNGFNFNFTFEHNCIFYEFILFPCRIITLLTIHIEGKHSRGNAQRSKKAYLNLLIVFVI